MGKQKTDQRAKAQSNQRNPSIYHSPFSIAFRRFPGHIHPGSVVGNDEIVQIGRIVDQTVCQRPLPAEQAAHRIGLADHDTGNIGQSGIFGDLIRNIVSNRRFYFGAQLFRQIHVAAQALFVIVGQLRIARRFHKQCGKSALKGSGDPGSGVDHFGVGGR